MSSRDSLAIYVLVAWSFKTERGFVEDSWLHDSIFKRHLGQLLGISRKKQRVLVITSRIQK